MLKLFTVLVNGKPTNVFFDNKENAKAFRDESSLDPSTATARVSRGPDHRHGPSQLQKVITPKKKKGKTVLYVPQFDDVPY